MINDKTISGLVVLSEGQWGCYPFMESIRSFFPVVDEVVVSFNVYGREDGSREKLESLGKKVRIVPTIFDLDKYGWVSYGVARTVGYHACRGDVVLMFDAEGILHEDDHDRLRDTVEYFIGHPGSPIGYWEKYRFYMPTVYWPQHKHSGIYNKAVLGDRFDFMHPSGRGKPNFTRLEEGERRAKNFGVYLFGYEKLWDTEAVLRHKVNVNGRKRDAWLGRPLKTPGEYFEEYIEALLRGLREKSKTMPLGKQPRIIQDKLKGINGKHFGHSLFGRWK